MRTEEQIKNKVTKLKRRLGLLYKYRDEINFDVSNASIPSSEYEQYTKDIEYIRGKLKGITWVLDGETL